MEEQESPTCFMILRICLLHCSFINLKRKMSLLCEHPLRFICYEYRCVYVWCTRAQHFINSIIQEIIILYTFCILGITKNKHTNNGLYKLYGDNIKMEIYLGSLDFNMNAYCTSVSVAPRAGAPHDKSIFYIAALIVSLAYPLRCRVCFIYDKFIIHLWLAACNCTLCRNVCCTNTYLTFKILFLNK